MIPTLPSLLTMSTDQLNNEMDITISTASMTKSTASATKSTANATESTPSAITVATLDSTFDRSMILIGALLPTVSIILLVILAVTIIVLTLWKARKKKKEMDLQDDPYNGLT